jgi:hypothetical protein
MMSLRCVNNSFSTRSEATMPPLVHQYRDVLATSESLFTSQPPTRDCDPMYQLNPHEKYAVSRQPFDLASSTSSLPPARIVPLTPTMFLGGRQMVKFATARSGAHRPGRPSLEEAQFWGQVLVVGVLVILAVAVFVIIRVWRAPASTVRLRTMSDAESAKLERLADKIIAERNETRAAAAESKQRKTAHYAKVLGTKAD